MTTDEQNELRRDNPNIGDLPENILMGYRGNVVLETGFIMIDDSFRPFISKPKKRKVDWKKEGF